MEDNLLSMMEGVYAPEQPVAPFPDQPDLPEAQSPNFDFLGGGRSSMPGGSGINLQAELQNVVNEATKNSKGDYYRAFDPIGFNRKESGFDPIYNSFSDGLYKKLGFRAGTDNEDRYATELGKSGQLWQGIKGVLPLAGLAHNEAWKQEADFWSGLASGDLKKAFALTMDKEDIEKLNRESAEVFNSNFVPLTMEQREGSFNMGKFSRGLQQFGFTAGTLLQFAEQSAIEWGAEILAAPETALGSIGLGIANTTRRAIKAASTIEKVYNVSNAMRKIMAFENKFLDANKLRNVFEFSKDAIKASPVGSFSNFYRFSKEYNMAASEARFERAQSFGDYVDKKEQEFQEKWNRPMTDSERKVVEEEAMKISNANGLTNIALLYAMNRINMSNVLRSGFGLSRRLEKEAVEGIADEIVQISRGPGFFNKLFKKGAKKAGAEATEAAANNAPQDMFMAARNVKRFSNEWWKGTGNKIYRWGTDSAWEGFQEVAQNVSAKYWESYYTDKFKQNKDLRDNWNMMLENAGNAFGKAVKSQVSTEGLDMFVSGFIIGGPSSMINMATGAVQKAFNKEAFAKRDAMIDEKVNFLNEWARSPFAMFDPKKNNYTDQLKIAEGMRKAVSENNPYAYHNLSRKAFQQAIMTLHETGKLPAMFDMMKQAAKDLSDQEFFEAFGIQSDSLSRKTAGEYIASLETRAEKLVKNLDDVKRKMPNPYNYQKFKTGSKERRIAEIKHLAWSQALTNYVFERDAEGDVIDRYKGLMTNVEKRLGGMAYNGFYTLTNEEFIKSTQTLLRDEIRQLELQPEDAATRELLNKKRKEFDQLEQWKNSYASTEIPDEQKFQYFADYINSIQKAEKLPEISADDLRESFKELSDIYKLDEDRRVIIRNLNYLADPENFSTLADMHETFISSQYKAMMELLDKEMEQQAATAKRLSEDEEFRNKHEELYQYYLLARAEGKNEVAAAILTAIHNEEINPKTEEEKKIIALKYNIKQIEDKLAQRIQALIANGATPEEAEKTANDEMSEDDKKALELLKKELADLEAVPTTTENEQTSDSTQSTTPTVEDVKKLIDAAKTEDELLDLLIRFEDEDGDLHKLFTKDQIAELTAAVDAKALAIKPGSVPGQQQPSGSKVTYISKDSPEFIEKYNEALGNIKAALNKPNITEKDINDAYKALRPIIELLDPTERAPIVNKHVVEKNDLLEKVKLRASTMNLAGKKAFITDQFNKLATLDEMLTASVVILEQADESIVEELRQHIEKEYDAYVDRTIAKLSKNANTSGMSAVRAKLLANKVKFSEMINKSMVTLSEKAEALQEATTDMDLDVEYDDNWTNPIHRSIASWRSNPKATRGQIAEAKSMNSVKLITNEELENALEEGTMLALSEIINRGVARSHTLKLNKLLYKALVSRNFKDFEEALVKYRELSDFNDARNVTKQDIKDLENFDLEHIDDVLEILGIPKTNLLDDKQFKLLDNYTSTLSSIHENIALLDILRSLEDRQHHLIEQGNPITVEKILTRDLVDLIKKYALEKKATKEELDAFYEAMKTAAVALKEATSEQDVKKTLNDLAANYAKSSSVEDAKSLFSAVLSFALEADYQLNNDESTKQEISVDEARDIINTGNKSLSIQDIKTVEELAKTELRSTLFNKLATITGTSVEVTYNPDFAEVTIYPLPFNRLRQKFEDDQRTVEELAKQLGADNGVISAVTALRMIVDSPYATEAEKALAEELLKVVPADQQITVDNTMNSGGAYNQTNNMVSINLMMSSYIPGKNSYPVEGVILHELLHSVIDNQLSDENGEFFKAIKNLYNLAKGHPAAKTFYAFQDMLSNDNMRLHEFITEAFTNPAFQYLLSTIKYNNTKKSLWDRFIEMVNKVIKAIGGNTTDSLLNEVLNQTISAIAGEQPGAGTSSEVEQKNTEEEFDPLAPKLYKRIAEATSDKELKVLKAEVEQAYKNNLIPKMFYESLNKAIQAKKSGFKAIELGRVYMNATPISVDGKPYRYVIDENGLTVLRPHRVQGAVKVTSSDVKQAVMLQLFKKSSSFAKILPESVKQIIKDLGGDPRDAGSYMNGGMDNSMSAAELYYGDVLAMNPSLNFGDLKTFKQFEREFRTKALPLRGTPRSYMAALDELGKKYGISAVKNYSELFYRFGNAKDISRLVESGILGLGKGKYIEEVNYELGHDNIYDLFDKVLAGENLDKSPESYVRESIAKILSKFFGSNLTPAQQKEIENDIFLEDYVDEFQEETDEDTPPPPPPPTPDLQVDDDIIIYSTMDATQVEDPLGTDFTAVDPDSSTGAQEKYALRSKPMDLDFNGQPTANYKNFYHKVRSIINILSLKPVEELAGMHVTLHKDDMNLRWDGSSTDSELQRLMEQGNVGVIGYISDEFGNPIVFDKTGQRVGTIDRNNLSDHKDLNNGENQIVYFFTAKPTTSNEKMLERNSYQNLMSAREKVMNGEPQIANILGFRQGHFNNKVLVNASDKRQNRADTRNSEFLQQLTQPHVEIMLSNKSNTLLAVIKGEDGSTNSHGLYPINTGEMRIGMKKADGTMDEMRMFDYLLEVMKTFHEMRLRNEPLIGDIEENLVYFVRNFWFTSDDFLKIVPNGKNNVGRIGIKIQDEKRNGLYYFSMVIPGSDGEVRLGADADLKLVRNFLNRRPVRIAKEWLSGSKPFKFPYIVEENGQKTLKFVEKDYKDFLFRQVGMKSNIVEIKSQSDLTRYNSTVHFDNPQNLDIAVSPTPVATQEEVVAKPDIVQDNVKETVKNTQPSVQPKSVKKNRFGLPAIDQIYNKSCK